MPSTRISKPDVMINKRLLVKNLLAHNDENSFYDKKRKVQLRISGKTYINRNNDKSIKSWVNKDMAILLGEDDLGSRTKPLSNGQMARDQGPNCLTRGKLLYSKTKTKAEELGFDFNWELITVPGVGHDNYKLAPFASIYLFGDKQENE